MKALIKVSLFAAVFGFISTASFADQSPPATQVGQTNNLPCTATSTQNAPNGQAPVAGQQPANTTPAQTTQSR